MESMNPTVRWGVMQSILEQDDPAAIETAARLGFDGLELAIDGLEATDARLWRSTGRDELARWTDAASIEVPSIALNVLNQGNVTASDPDVRSRATRAIGRAIDAAADLDVPVILVPFFGPAEITEREHEDRLVESMQPLTEAAAAAGVTLGLETTLSGAANHRLVERIDSAGVGVYYDVANATHWGHDPVSELRDFADDIVGVHFKDAGTGSSDAPLGEGRVDFPGVRDALRTIRYKGWIVLESVPGDDPAANAARNLGTARRLLSD